MEQILLNKLKETSRELVEAMESDRKYHEKRENIALGSLMTIVELLKELKED